MAIISFLKGDKVDNNVDYRDALPVNYYAVSRNIFESKGYMLNYFGLTSFATGSGISRGSIWVSRLPFRGQYRVSGTSLLRVEDDGGLKNLGTIPGSGQASMTYSLNNLAIVADNRLYYYNPSKGLRQITDADIGGPIDIVWADFRFILTDGEFLFQSDITNEESYLPLEFTGSDFQPDAIIGVGLNEDNQLVAFNSLSTEYYFNSGSENFAYTRITSKSVKIGIVGTHAKVEYKDKWYCCGRRVNSQPYFMIIQSGTSNEISTREIEKLLSVYNDDELSTIVIEFFKKDDVKFMVAHLPDKTLLFNENLAETIGIENAWSILKTDVLGDVTYRGKDMVFDPRFSKWIIGDKQGSNIGFLDDSTCSQYGNIVEGLLFSPLMRIETGSIDIFECETISGVAPNESATVFISLSYDGRTHGKEWTQLYGDNQDYNQRFYLRRLGYVRQNVSLRLRTASPDRMSFTNFNLEVS